MNTKPKVTAIMATCGRHFCSERSLRLFLDQDYDNKKLLIYQNSDQYQILDKFYDNVNLINCYIDSKTQRSYTSLGDIYNDAIRFVDADTDIICFWDDDDLFLVNHLSEGVKGLIGSGKKAYKPSRSYYRDSRGVHIDSNTLEPSIFVKFDIIKQYGFSSTTTQQHHQWLSPIQNEEEISVDPNGTPTLIYNWGDNFPTYKTSGDYNNPENFNNYKKFSQDHGDRVITPLSDEEIDKYHNLIA